jgi:hypothetical protein
VHEAQLRRAQLAELALHLLADDEFFLARLFLFRSRCCYLVEPRAASDPVVHELLHRRRRIGRNVAADGLRRGYRLSLAQTQLLGDGQPAAPRFTVIFRPLGTGDDVVTVGPSLLGRTRRGIFGVAVTATTTAKIVGRPLLQRQKRHLLDAIACFVSRVPA